jgi:hypothetical protein
VARKTWHRCARQKAVAAPVDPSAVARLLGAARAAREVLGVISAGSTLHSADRRGQPYGACETRMIGRATPIVGVVGGVAVGVGVLVAVADPVTVAVPAGVRVAVGVGEVVGVNTLVAVAVGVDEAVGVVTMVLVAVGVGVGGVDVSTMPIVTRSSVGISSTR